MRIHLKRVFGVGAVRIDKRLPSMSLELSGQQPFDERFDLGLTEMQQMAGIVECKAVLAIGAAQPSHFCFTFVQPIRGARQVIRGAKSGESGPDHWRTS